jgi:putative transposase
MSFKVFKYKLYPSKKQASLMEETVETCRRWYNVCLEDRKNAWEKEKRNVNRYDQSAKIHDYRANNPFAARVYSHIFQVVVADLDKAFQAFFRRVKFGGTPGYPRFKGKGRFNSFGFPGYADGFRLDGRRLKLSNIGRVRVRWHRQIEGKIKTLRICKQAGEWYACFTCEIPEKPALPETGKAIGIDVGIHHLIATSEGETIENPKYYRASQKKLRILNRTLSRRKKGGSNRHKAVIAIQKHYQHVTNQREDYLNKLVYRFIQGYDLIAIEDLQIVNMVRNHCLAKSILDAGWGYFKTHLLSKAVEAGRVVVAVNPAYTSKTCSSCGTIFEHLDLSVRWVKCDCGLSMDRDINAAINILYRAGRARSDESTAIGLRLSEKPLSQE